MNPFKGESVGVMGTFCQVCGMPTNYDHYSNESDTGMIEIKRNEDLDDSDIAFGPEHSWLESCVVLPVYPYLNGKILRGKIEDGRLIAENDDSIFVSEGKDEGFALHEKCWALAGSPKNYEALSHISESVEFRDLTQYHDQFFDFNKLIDDGKSWMLSDPDSTSDEGIQNRKRILSILNRSK
jgi:hypothetical protein